jgi:Motility quorum-sensing regulator, toxin of MqsA
VNAASVTLGGLGEDPRTGDPAEGALHYEALQELAPLGLDEGDACNVLPNLAAGDFVERLVSKRTGEWMYVFKPTVGGAVVYVKVILHNDCVVISFHEEGHQSDEDYSNGSIQRTRRGAVRPDDANPECGSSMREKMGRLKRPVNGEEITVTEATHLSLDFAGV